MYNIKKLIFKTETGILTPPVGVEVSAKRGVSSCLVGICTLNNSVVDIIIYTSDGGMSDGQTIYSDISLTTPYLTSNFVSNTGLGAIYVFSVNGSGVLSLVCITDEGC